MVSKSKSKENQQQMRLQQSRIKKKFKCPYDCPKCFGNETVNIGKLNKTDKTTLWIVLCNKCNLMKQIELPNILGQIDVYNRILDIVNKEELK